MPQQDGAPNTPIIPQSGPLGGVSLENILPVLLMHSHDGSAMGGKLLYGPYFIKDTADGHTYKLTCTNGVLGVTLVV